MNTLYLINLKFNLNFRLLYIMQLRQHMVASV